jgi:sigma-B regulation protein RsbU (phosphoserine phosphatase)
MIYSACKGKLLMTMCLIQLNLDSGEIRICNAGHESPLCLRRNKVSGNTKSTDTKRDAETDVLFARGERLGFDPNSQYESTSYRLSPGDTVLLYTDGISEAEDGSGKQWGERKLKKAFARRGPRPLDQLKDQIVEELNEHTNGVQQKDDITFVLFTLKAGRSKQKLLTEEDSDQDQAA